ncbi:copia protein [Tanacetum coccineum]
MASNEETNAAGTDTRPPMLVESDYDSWKIRIHRYIRGKPNGKLIWKSIQNGPTPHPMITDPPPTDSAVVPAPRKKLDSEFSRTIQQRKEDLFDEYERFRAIGNESIHDYFVRFHKLVNDMKITQLNIPTHQMNTKFVNNLPAYWGKSILISKPTSLMPKRPQETGAAKNLQFPTHNNSIPDIPPTQGLCSGSMNGHIVQNQFREGARRDEGPMLLSLHAELSSTSATNKVPVEWTSEAETEIDDITDPVSSLSFLTITTTEAKMFQLRRSGLSLPTEIASQASKQSNLLLRLFWFIKVDLQDKFLASPVNNSMALDDENVSMKRRYDELSKANNHSRIAYTEKLSAFTAENTKLKAQVTGTTSSGPSTSETPKVLAPGMYNLGSKYIPPPKRANWVKPTPVPKKKQVTFSEPPRPSLKPTQKPVVHPNKQTNVCVPMSTGVKPTSGASKTVPKEVPHNHISIADLRVRIARNQLGNSKKATHPQRRTNTNIEVLHTLHMDLCGPMRTESINGKKYALVIVDDYTRFGWTLDEMELRVLVFLMKTSVPRVSTTERMSKERNLTLMEAARDLCSSLRKLHVPMAELVATGVVITLKAYLLYTKTFTWKERHPI